MHKKIYIDGHPCGFVRVTASHEPLPETPTLGLGWGGKFAKAGIGKAFDAMQGTAGEDVIKGIGKGIAAEHLGRRLSNAIITKAAAAEPVMQPVATPLEKKIGIEALQGLAEEHDENIEKSIEKGGEVVEKGTGIALEEREKAKEKNSENKGLLHKTAFIEPAEDKTVRPLPPQSKTMKSDMFPRPDTLDGKIIPPDPIARPPSDHSKDPTTFPPWILEEKPDPEDI